jgi:hypothetical protein
MIRLMPGVALSFVCALHLFLSGCVSDTPSVKVEKGSLPPELTRYCDSFDTFRDDLWDKLGFIPDRDKKAGEFRLADVRIQKGMVRVETKTGCFSLGGLGSKFVLRGNYDIQIDCHPQFLQDAKDMDQVVVFSLVDKTKELQDQELESVNLGLSKASGRSVVLFTGVREGGKFQRTKAHPVEDFKGSLRVARAGTRVTTLFRREGDPRWTEMGTFTRPANDVILSFKVQNFTVERDLIGAKSSFVVHFDDFRTNKAEKILESEI